MADWLDDKLDLARHDDPVIEIGLLNDLLDAIQEVMPGLESQVLDLVSSSEDSNPCVAIRMLRNGARRMASGMDYRQREEFLLSDQVQFLEYASCRPTGMGI